jgi:signal transduction histidine kinase
MKGNSTLIEHQLRVRCRNGDYRWLFLRGKVMDWNMQGRALRIVGSVRDVEEEKQQADHERTRNEQILHTARLVSMGEIASALAHEINQPLTAICNFSAVALHKLKTKVPERSSPACCKPSPSKPCGPARLPIKSAASSKRARPPCGRSQSTA